MHTFTVVFNDYLSDDEGGHYYSETVEASSFGINYRSGDYEFYDSRNDKVFSAPSQQVLFVKRK